MISASRQRQCVTAAGAGRSSPRRRLRATTERTGSALIVDVSGDIDASNEQVWENLLSKLGATVVTPGPLIVDARGMTFIGCGAFLILGQQARRCRRRGVLTQLISTEPIVARMTGVLGLRALLSLHPSIGAALSTPQLTRRTGFDCDRVTAAATSHVTPHIRTAGQSRAT